MGSRKIIRSKAEGSNIRNRIEDSRGMRSHSRAIHNNRAIPRIIRNRGMDSNRITRSKVEGIKLILSRGMANSKDTLNKAMPNSKTISNRAMDNHLPGMLRPKKRRP